MLGVDGCYEIFPKYIKIVTMLIVTKLSVYCGRMVKLVLLCAEKN